MSKFLLAEDQSQPGSAVHIIHLHAPVAIFRIEDDHSDAQEYRSYHFEDEIWVLVLLYLDPSFPDPNLDTLFNDAWKWYTDVFYGL